MTSKNSDQVLESLSAAVDGEAGELEMRRLLKQLDQSAETSDESLLTWERYHLIGRVMRDEGVSAPSVDLAGRVSLALDEEAVLDDSTSNQSPVSRPILSGFWGQSMVAASVAACFILGVNFMGSPSDSSNQLLVDAAEVGPGVNTTVSQVPLGFDLPLPESKVVSSSYGAINGAGVDARAQPAMQTYYSSEFLSDAETQALLNQFLIEHAERSSVNGGLGLMPFARVSKMSEADK